jgi:hypothetical protein
MLDSATLRKINEASVRRFFASWDPAWRWILILGLRDLRANADRLGALAATEVGNETWGEERYVYGPLVKGITAAAVNEASQHCEDLFALLTFLREPKHFAKQMGAYSAGRVTKLADKLAREDDWAIAKRFLVPTRSTFKAGLLGGEDPATDLEVVDAGVKRLGDLVREVAEFYATYEFFHIQYKHGLKIPLRPFGDPNEEAIAERKLDLKSPLIALSNEATSKMVRKPPSQQAMMIPDPGPDARGHMAELVTEREIFRYQMSGPEVDLADVARLSHKVVRLLQLAATNRQALGERDDDGLQTIDLPGAGRFEVIKARLVLPALLTLGDFN